MAADIDGRSRLGSQPWWLIAGALVVTASFVYAVCSASSTSARSRVLEAEGPYAYTPHGEHEVVEVEFSAPTEDGIVKINFLTGALYPTLDVLFGSHEPVDIDTTRKALELVDGKGSVDIPFRIAGPGVGSIDVTIELPEEDRFESTQNYALWLGRSADGTLLYSKMSEVSVGISMVCLDHPKDVRAQVAALARMGIGSRSPGTGCRELLRYWKRA